MPRFSAFTPCGVFRLSSKPSPGKLFYEQLKQLYASAQNPQQPFDFTKPVVVQNVTTQGSGHMEARVYAMARMLARHAMVLEKAKTNKDGATAYDLLPLLELDYELTPGPNDGYYTRQQAVAAAQRMPLGNGRANLQASLKGILGSNFLGYIPGPARQTNTAPVVGSSAGLGHFADVRQPVKFLQLVDPVLTTGTTSYCTYQNLDSTIVPTTLVPGEFVVVQGENSQLIEVVQVTGAWYAPPAAANGTASTLTAPAGTPTWSAGTPFVVGQLVAPATPNGFWFQCSTTGITGTTEPSWPGAFGVQVSDGSTTWVAIGASTVFSAVFQRAHDAGASVLSGNFPFWWSTQRYNVVVVASNAAVDHEQRRKVDVLMSKTMRGVSTWAIVAGTPVPGGPTFSIAPLSAGAGMGTAPLGSFTGTP